MTSPAPAARDPVLRHVFQPIVDRTCLDPRVAAIVAADVFVALAVTLAALRVATIDPATRPDLHVWQAQHVVGAAIVYGWMRFCVAAQGMAHVGPMGLLHVVFRWTMLACLALDVHEVAVLTTTDPSVAPMMLLRSSLQLAETAAAVCALYLSLCRRPPPRRRTERRVAASATT
jgi:hypothetical protein